MTSQAIVATSPTGPGDIQVPAGLYLGEGFLPLPQRLVDKIARLEYVKMAELQWSLASGGSEQYQVLPFYTKAPESTSNWCIDLGPVLRIAGQCTLTNLP